MAILITQYEIQINGKAGSTWERIDVNVSTRDFHELEIYRKMLKNKHGSDFVFLKYKQVSDEPNEKEKKERH